MVIMGWFVLFALFRVTKQNRMEQKKVHDFNLLVRIYGDRNDPNGVRVKAFYKVRELSLC